MSLKLKKCKKLDYDQLSTTGVDNVLKDIVAYKEEKQFTYMLIIIF